MGGVLGFGRGWLGRGGEGVLSGLRCRFPRASSMDIHFPGVSGYSGWLSGDGDLSKGTGATAEGVDALLLPIVTMGRFSEDSGSSGTSAAEGGGRESQLGQW